MNSDAISRIKKFLSIYNKDFESLTNNQKEKLLLIDNAIQNRLNSINNAKQTIKENAITLVTISKDTGILRPTFYQQPLFEAYIKSYMETDTKELSDNMVKTKEKEIKSLQNDLSNLSNSDFDWASKLADAESSLDSLLQDIMQSIDLLENSLRFMSDGVEKIKVQKAIDILKKNKAVYFRCLENDAKQLFNDVKNGKAEVFEDADSLIKSLES